MSRASKITLGLSCLVTSVTVVAVHIIQDMERETLHQGPVKDAKRVAEKKAMNERSETEKDQKRLFNKNEHEYQLDLRKQYEAVQPLSGDIVTENGDKVSNQ